MTAIYYPDCWGTSTSRNFVLEARSPHNGRINHLDGSPATDDEFGFKYREHQSDFRYRLVKMSAGARESVIWERWQQKAEDSPRETLVSDEGWAVIRTHGFSPELIVVSPQGLDTLRVQIVFPEDDAATEDKQIANRGATAVKWVAKEMSHTTAGNFWAENSWPSFLQWEGKHYFIWRTYWGDRVVVCLEDSLLIAEAGAGLRSAMDAAEARDVLQLLVDLSHHANQIERHLASDASDEHDQEPPDWLQKLPRATAALHLAGVHGIKDAVPLLRWWERIDCLKYSSSSSALGRHWNFEPQYFRPIVRHSLKVLGDEPSRLAAYHFRLPDEARLTLDERSSFSPKRAAEIDAAMTALEVLKTLGTPDYVWGRSYLIRPGLYGRIEQWEYDMRLEGRWTTLRITWEGERIRAVEEIAPYWLQTDERLHEFLRF